MRYYIISLLLVSTFGCQTAPKQTIETVEHGIPWANEIEGAEIGAILVPENHDEPNGRKIKIVYWLSKAKNDSSKEYPIIYFSGGHGGNSIDKEMGKFIRDVPLNRDRDIIFFDQRGIGYSDALPDMSLESFDILAKDANEEDELNLTKELINKYRKKCEELGINLSNYNTHQNAKDVGLLFKHLGYEKYNLLGGSYGTRLGRVVQDFFPEYVNSVIHNSPAPMSTDFLTSRLDSYSLALERIFNFCESDSTCIANFPNLKAEYFEAIEQLKKEPIKIDMSDTSSFFVNAQDGIYLIRRLLYQTNAREDAPKLIRALKNGEGDIIKNVIDFEYQMTGGINISMLLAVEKYENFDPANTDKVIDEQYRNYPLIPARLAFFDPFYRAGSDWHGGNLPKEKRLFQKSDVPTLIMVNQYDPVTPPEYGHQFMKELTNGHLLILDEGGHGGGNPDCRDSVMIEFMGNPSKLPDVSCLNLYKEE